MSSPRLESYSANFRKLAEAAEQAEQMRAIRVNRFRASLVKNPIEEDISLAKAFEFARKR